MSMVKVRVIVFDRTYELTSQVFLPLKRTDVFDLFADAANLEKLTPPFLQFHVVTPLPVEMKCGALIDYRLRLHGFPIRWRTEITEWEPPFRFQDSQIRGPYSMWVHSHEFEETDGGTVVKDLVRYSMFGGTLVHSMFVKGDLRRIFEYRQARLPELLTVNPATCESEEIQIDRVSSDPLLCQ